MDMIQPEHVLAAINSFYGAPAPLLIKPSATIKLETKPAPAATPVASKKFTLVVRCREDHKLLQQFNAFARWAPVADLVYTSGQNIPELEEACIKNGFSYTVGATEGLQVKKALGFCKTPFFVTVRTPWELDEYWRESFTGKLETAPQRVLGLVHKKAVPTEWQAKFPQPMIKDCRRGQGFIVLYPGRLLLAGHAAFLRQFPVDVLEAPMVLGEAIRQSGGQLVESGTDFLHP
jgi:hypothetical protein